MRAGAYVFAGLVAWIHAFEGFFLVAVLGSVDVATARSNGWRDLAVVALALSLALAPTLATNLAIADNPLKPPRLLPGVGVGGVELAPGGDLVAADSTGGVRTGGGGETLLGSDGGADANGGGTTGGGEEAGSGSGSSGADGGSQDAGPIGWLAGFLAGITGALLGLLPRPPDTLLVILGFVLSTVMEGLTALSQPDQLWAVFVRSGRIPGVNYAINQYEVIELTVLESMPLLGAFAALPFIAVGRLRRRGRAVLRWPRDLTPARKTDLLVATLAVVFTVIYLSRLPLHAMLTVRYVLPIFVLGLYGLARLPPVASCIRDGTPRLAGAYGTTLLAGGLSILGLFWVIDPALGEAVQFHALLNLTVAVSLASVVLARTVLRDRVPTRWVATGLGVAAGVTTLYIAFAGLAYFTYGSYAFDGVNVLADSLAWLA